MATYKVIQDIEAEDKLLGPLSLRQFIYAAICVGGLFLCYMLISRAGSIGLLFTPLFFVPAAFFGFLAFPFSKDQPTELWALARVNFLFKPRKRIWDQGGMRELVSITAPKRVEKQYTDGLSQTEVKSRLRALAETLDSRGWAVKNAGQQYANPLETNPDRLVDASALPQEVAAEVYDDPLDPSKSGQVAQHFDDMLRANEQQHRQQLIAQMEAPATPAPAAPQPPQDYWFMTQSQAPADAPTDNVMFGSQVVNPGQPLQSHTPKASNEGELLDELKQHELEKPKSYAHLPTIQPLDVQRKQAEERQKELARQQAIAAAQQAIHEAQSVESTQYDQLQNSTDIDPSMQQTTAQSYQPPAKPMTPKNNAAILELSQNDDLTIETVARQANKTVGKTVQNADGSVEISLH